MDYISLQDRRNAEYEEAYDQWIASLDEESAKQLADISPLLTQPHLEKPSHTPDYSFMENTEIDRSQDDFISGKMFDPEDEPEESAEDFNGREGLKESIVGLILNIESADSKPAAIGVACVALGVRGASGEDLVDIVASQNGMKPKVVKQMAALFLDDVNCGSDKDLAVLRRIVAQLAQTGNPALSLDVLRISTGICNSGENQSEVARRHGVSRQAVHKRKKRFKGILGLRG